LYEGVSGHKSPGSELRSSWKGEQGGWRRRRGESVDGKEMGIGENEGEESDGIVSYRVKSEADISAGNVEAAPA
jgi:hypothetical protein